MSQLQDGRHHGELCSTGPREGGVRRSDRDLAVTRKAQKILSISLSLALSPLSPPSPAVTSLLLFTPHRAGRPSGSDTGYVCFTEPTDFRPGVCTDKKRAEDGLRQIHTHKKKTKNNAIGAKQRENQNLCLLFWETKAKYEELLNEAEWLYLFIIAFHSLHSIILFTD